MTATAQELDLGRYKLGWSDVEDFYVFKPKKGLSEEIIREMSWMKGEPEWMTQRRLKALRYFERRPDADMGGDMSGIDFDDIFYYIKPIDKQVAPGTSCPTRSRPPMTSSGSPKPSASTWPASPPSTSPRSSTTATGRSSKPRASCSAIWTRPCGSIPTWSSSTSARSSRPTTTSSPPSTRPCGPGARSSTCRPGSRSRCPCRPTSGSTPKTWASSSGP